jgi:hypothetical protein
MWDILQSAFWLIVFGGLVYWATSSVRQAIMVTSFYAFLELCNVLLDWILWPLFQGLVGGWSSFALLTFLAFSMNIGLLWMYEKKGQDYLGVGILEDLKAKGLAMSFACEGKTLFGKTVHIVKTAAFKSAMWMARSDFVVFIVLSCAMDSFVCLGFMRKGRFGPLTRNDKLVFVTSTIVSCGFWTLITDVVTLKAIKHVWELVA